LGKEEPSESTFIDQRESQKPLEDRSAKTGLNWRKGVLCPETRGAVEKKTQKPPESPTNGAGAAFLSGKLEVPSWTSAGGGPSSMERTPVKGPKDTRKGGTNSIGGISNSNRFVS